MDMRIYIQTIAHSIEEEERVWNRLNLRVLSNEMVNTKNTAHSHLLGKFGFYTPTEYICDVFNI